MRLPKAFVSLICLTLALGAFAADPLEGRWQVNSGGALVEIVGRPGNDGSMSMRWIDGPDFSIASGEEIAIVYPSATVGVYDCTASSDPRARGKAKGRDVNFVIRFAKDNPDAVEFEAYENSKRISLWRWLPYMFRITVVDKKNRPRDLEGARRVDAPPMFITL